MENPNSDASGARPKRSPFTSELPDLSDLPASRLSLMAGALTNRLSHIFPRWLDSHLSNEWDLTGPRLMLIALVRRNKSLTMSEAAELLDVTPRAITRLVDGLEKDGLVVRVASTLDKRVFELKVTPLAEAKLTELLPIHEERMAELFHTFTVEELREFVRLSNKFLRSLKDSTERED